MLIFIIILENSFYKLLKISFVILDISTAYKIWYMTLFLNKHKYLFLGSTFEHYGKKNISKQWNSPKSFQWNSAVHMWREKQVYGMLWKVQRGMLLDWYGIRTLGKLDWSQDRNIIKFYFKGFKFQVKCSRKLSDFFFLSNEDAR